MVTDDSSGVKRNWAMEGWRQRWKTSRMASGMGGVWRGVVETSEARA